MLMRWKITGFIATIIILVSIPAYILKQLYFTENKSVESLLQADFTGSETCIECHKLEYDLWFGTDHDRAMEVANDSSVMGDFNDVVFNDGLREHRFYKKDGRFYVYTDGPDGNMQEFEITHTFGVRPLQQYLVPFDGGKYQCLPIAWDSENSRWFDMAAMVYPDEDLQPGNWLFWTNQAQNWNGMCADCHSTNLRKGFDPETKTYNTTFSEIDVSCEACHGPASAHLDWASYPELSRPLNTNTGLVVKTSSISTNQYVDLCARCHSRRGMLEDYNHESTELLDYMIPSLPVSPMYFSDGQILEEDYVFASFTQSRMYMEDVRCNDCHNVHSLKFVKEGNALCLQCHREERYDTYDHHFHKYTGENGEPLMMNGEIHSEVGEGALCINCHMPGRYYMGIDFRRDHSFRIPDPWLTENFGVPNACNNCHLNESNQWASAWLDDWYGKSSKFHYGTLLAAGTEQLPEALPELAKIISDELYSEIVRASALTIISNYQNDTSHQIVRSYLDSPFPLIRYTAANHFYIADTSDIRYISPLLNDPVKAVRMEAAILLSNIPKEYIKSKYHSSLSKALDEYKKANEYMADFAPSRTNLGNMYSNLGQAEKAIQQYQEAIAIDDLFLPAKSNLVILYNQQGENEKAEKLLREIILSHPDNFEAYYSLGLLLAELKKYDEAIDWMEQAGGKMPERSRIFYNLGLMNQMQGNYENAEFNLLKAIQLEAENFDYLYALADFYIKRKNLEKARYYAGLIKTTYPESTVGEELIRYIDQE